MKFNPLLFIFLLSLLGNSVFSQTHHFRNYSVDDGLPFIQVSAIFQDNRGNLWTGGYGGLSKFDGNQFVNYTTRNGLISHSVTSIAQDDSGNIWIGTISGVSKFNGKTFTNYNTYEGLAGDAVNAIIYDSNANLWFATKTGVTKYDGQKFINYTGKDGLPASNVNTIYEAEADEIWFGTDHGVSRFNGEVFQNFSVKNGMCDSVVTSIVQDYLGNMWFGTRKGISVFDGENFINYTTQNGLPADDIKVLRLDALKNIWAGTEKGLGKFNADQDVDAKASFTQYHPDKDINSNKVYSLYLDYEGSLWVGTYNGMFRYHGDGFTSYNENAGLTNTFIYAILRDNSTNFLVGTSGGGLFNYKAGRFVPIGKDMGFTSTNVNCFLQDANDVVWIGTNTGLSRYNSKALAKGEKKIFTTYTRKDGLLSDSINIIIKDHLGHLWMGGQNSITMFDGKTFHPYPVKSSLSPDFGVYSMVEDNDHNIWFGTWLGGLFRFDGKEIKEYGQVLGLKSASVFAITKDHAGNLFFGTFEGVFMYDGKKLVNFSEVDGMSSDLVYNMAFGYNGKSLWVGTNQGVNKISIDEYLSTGKKIIKHYGKEEGFIGVECNTNGAFLDKDSSIWFGTVNGLIRYDPNEYLYNTAESKTNITSILLFEKDTMLVQGTELPFNLNHISFKFTGVSLTDPAKVRYRYMLEGLDKDWLPETKYNFADYANLPPGKYTFKVRSCNSEGMWNIQSTSFSFSIARPAWKTWWFWGLVFVITSVIIIAGLRIRIRQIRKVEQAELKRKVEMAGHELKALRSQMNPHFIFNSLNSIQSFILNSNEQAAAKYLNKFAKLIRIILNNSEKSNVTIFEEMEAVRLYVELEELRFENKFDYKIEIGPSVDTDYFEIPTMLIQPYIENAILHGLVPKAGKGFLHIKLEQNVTHIICTIMDNGIGRKKAKEIKEASPKTQHASMGMKITRERLEMLNNINNSNLSVTITDLEDERQQPSGTKVEIYIPIT